MSESMRGTADSSDSCALAASSRHLQDTSSLQRLVIAVDEQSVRRDVRSLCVDVAPEDTSALVSAEDEPLFGAFAIDLDTPAIKVQITELQGGELGDPYPGVNEEA